MSKKRQNQKNRDYISIYGINGAVEILQSKAPIIGIDILEGGIATKTSKIMNRVNPKLYKVKKFQKEQFLGIYKNWRTQGIVIHITGMIVKSLPNLENQKAPSCLLLIDGVEDPQNIGQIMRTSECAGIDGIILAKHGSVHITNTVLQVSQGAFENIDLFMVTNVKNIIDKLKNNGFWIIGMENGIDSKEWYDMDYRKRI